MKKTTNITLALIAVLFSTAYVNAQTTPSTAPLNDSGTITISGSVSPKVDLKVINEAGAVANDSTVNFNDVSAGEATSSDATGISGAGFNVRTVKLEVRSNTAYDIVVSAVGNTIGADNTEAFGLDDIGITVGDSAFQTGATLPDPNNSGFTMEDSLYYYGANGNDGSGRSNIVNGHAVFVKTLADVGSDRNLYRGTAVSDEGNASSTDNYVRTPLHFLIAPEFYTPTDGFSATVSVGIVAVPQP